MANREAVILGVGEADEMGRVPDKNVFQMQAEATKNAIEESGLERGDIDAVFIQGNGFRERFHSPQVVVSEYLGLSPKIASSNDLGGPTSYAHLHYAKLAIEAGVIDSALITYGSTAYSDRKRDTVSDNTLGPELNRQYEHPYGIVRPIGQYAHAARRYMYEHDVSRADLAEIAVSTREWAKLNPNAMVRDDLSVEGVLESPPVCEPLHKFDCCLVSDGGGAIVLAAQDRSREADVSPVRICGMAQEYTHDHISQMVDVTSTAAERTAREAYAMADLGPSDVDVAELYDSFTITVALLAEAVGLADQGEGTKPFVNGETRPGGSIPINTNGGGLSYNQPGTYGILTLIEAVRQVRGTAGERQVPDVETALAHASGGILSNHSTMIVQEAES